MLPVDAHRFEQAPGSLTWAVRRKDDWFACFAHYKGTSDPARSVVVRFDAQWQRVASWSFPAELIQRFAGSSASGGEFGPGGALFVTGHDARELYLLGIPASGEVLEWQANIPISAEGQAFCWDPVETNLLYSISRKAREVIFSRVSKFDAPAAALSPEETRLGFESLFDGKSFTGWEHKGNWVITNGVFHRKSGGGDLMWKVKPIPDDFELRFDWKVSKGCNSGVYYRPGQYEYQVLDNVNSPYGENPRQAAASLFFCMAPSRDATRPLGEWNEGRIVAKGTVIQHWLNGEAVIDFDYSDPRWAKEIELLRIRGADLAARGALLRLQDHGADVWFRNLRLRTIPAGERLARFPFTPMPVPPVALEKENARVRQMLKAKEKK
ncbi:MAG: DUF1080 domain-containing protein [Proteobacteria bacterium]|nr:DUF1080 domain-containing protein [Pseudomonadota bacterium]